MDIVVALPTAAVGNVHGSKRRTERDRPCPPGQIPDLYSLYRTPDPPTEPTGTHSHA
jgi:hypothetical protein